jgi:hypothetical protein
MPFVSLPLAHIAPFHQEAISQKTRTPPTPLFCDVYANEGLTACSVVYVCANKGLSGQLISWARTLRPDVFSREAAFRWPGPSSLL